MNYEFHHSLNVSLYCLNCSYVNTALRWQTASILRHRGHHSPAADATRQERCLMPMNGKSNNLLSEMKYRHFHICAYFFIIVLVRMGKITVFTLLHTSSLLFMSGWEDIYGNVWGVFFNQPVQVKN